MALINCEECGHDVSDKASSCPNCGCPVKKELVNIYVINSCIGNSGFISLYIDNEFICKMDVSANGESFFTQLTPGMHDYLVADGTETYEGKILINSSKRCPKGMNIRVSNLMGWVSVTSHNID